MSTRIRSITVRLVLATVAFGLTAPGLAQADWPRFGQAISTAPNAQTHAASTDDGLNGAIITWQDHRHAKVNIFVQHVQGSGDVDPGWPVNGRAMVADTSLAGPAGGNFSPEIVSDGAGGGIVTWVDLRDAASAPASDQLAIFAQHILASGVVDARWPADGLRVASAVGLQGSFATVSDGAGGAIVTWTDSRAGAGEFDVYAQRVLAAGRVDARWPANGLTVCAVKGLQEFPAIVGDGSGGAIITWDDARSPANSTDVFAQHVLDSGVVDPAWPANGLALCTAPGGQGRGTITTDGLHGAIVAWSDSRVLGTSHIFALRVLAAGTVDPAWPVNGTAISNAGFLESRPLVVPDDAGGAVVTWQALAVHLNMYAQHVKATGVVDPAWPAGGKALSITNRQQSGAQIVADGLGGAVVAWQDSFVVVAQRVLANGALDPAYPDTGRQVSDLTSDAGDIALVGTNRAGAIVAWTDTRNGKDTDIYAMDVLVANTVGVSVTPALESRLLRPVPNPAHGPLTVRFALPRDAHVKLDVYDASGRRVRGLVSGLQPAGQHAVTWDLREESGVALPAGLYFARLDVDGHSLTQKLVTLK